jgi:toxin CcdB
MHGLTPELSYQGQKFLLLTPQIASMPSKFLQNPIGSLSHFHDEIIAAIDFAITGI